MHMKTAMNICCLLVSFVLCCPITPTDKNGMNIELLKTITYNAHDNNNNNNNDNGNNNDDNNNIGAHLTRGVRGWAAEGVETEGEAEEHIVGEEAGEEKE